MSSLARSLLFEVNGSMFFPEQFLCLPSICCRSRALAHVIVLYVMLVCRLFATRNHNKTHGRLVQS